MAELSDVARLDTMVTVIDASTFLEECDGVDEVSILSASALVPGAESQGHGRPERGRRV